MLWHLKMMYRNIIGVSAISIQQYSRTSMARTSLGPWKFVRDMGSSSHWGLIMAPVQEANSDNLGKSFRFSTQWLYVESRPRWLSWMRHPTGDQEVAGSTPAEVGNILSWRLIMKYFLWSFSPFRWFKKGSCQFLAKECAQYWLTA